MSVLNLEKLLAPISPHAPVGTNLKRSSSAAFTALKNARKVQESRDIGMGDGAKADWRSVAVGASELLIKQTKDLEVACWLTLAITKHFGMVGLLDGLRLIRGLHERFGEALFPEDPEARAGLVGWLAHRPLVSSLLFVPLTEEVDGRTFSWNRWDEAMRLAGIGDAKVRQARVQEGWISIEEFNAVADATSAEFYVRVGEEVEACLLEVELLEALVLERYGDEDVSLFPLSGVLQKCLELIDRRRPRRLIPTTTAMGGFSDGLQPDASSGGLSLETLDKRAPGEQNNSDTPWEEVSRSAALPPGTIQVPRAVPHLEPDGSGPPGSGTEGREPSEGGESVGDAHALEPPIVSARPPENTAGSAPGDHAREARIPESTSGIGSSRADPPEVVHPAVDRGTTMIPEASSLEPQQAREVPSPPSGERTMGTAPAEDASGEVSADFGSWQPVDLLDVPRVVQKLAAFVREQEPTHPWSYLLLRALRWGELAASADGGWEALLEPPASEVRSTMRALHTDRRWRELLEHAEQAMGRVEGRGWLDLQYYSHEALEHLGPSAGVPDDLICAGVRALLHAFGTLPSAELTDGTPAAGAQTRAWLESLRRSAPVQTGVAVVQVVPSVQVAPLDAATRTGQAPPDPVAEQPCAPRHRTALEEALEQLKSGRFESGLAILQAGWAMALNGRDRFFSRLEIAELCLIGRRFELARPIVEALAEEVEQQRLEVWEDPQVCARVWSALFRCYQQGAKPAALDAQLAQKVFERLCKVDVARALEALETLSIREVSNGGEYSA